MMPCDFTLWVRRIEFVWSQYGHFIENLPTVVLMPERSSKRQAQDFDVLAAAIISEAIGDSEENPAAVALGRLGGLKGGPARKKKLSRKRWSKIARKVAEARWGK